MSVLGGLTKKHTNTLPVNLMSRELGSDDHEPDEYEHGHAIIFYEPFFCLVSSCQLYALHCMGTRASCTCTILFSTRIIIYTDYDRYPYFIIIGSCVRWQCMPTGLLA